MKNKFTLLIVLFCSVHLFGLYYRLGEVYYFILDGIGFSIIFLEIFLRKNSITHKSHLFEKPLILLYIALFISTISCYYFHGQNIIPTIIAMRYFLYLSIYFLLIQLNIEKNWIESFIIIGSILYIIVFLTQVLVYPIEIVDIGRIDEFNRGLLRFRIEGAGFLMLAGLLSLNRVFVNKKWIFSIFYILCMIGIFMLGFRTLLATAIFSSFILLIRISNKPFTLLLNSIFIAIILSGLYYVPIVNSYIKEVVEVTNNESDMSDDYIRYLTFDFYYHDVNKNNYTLILGNGFPQEDSEYGKYVQGEGVEDNGYIFQDIGLVGFGIIYGVITLIVYLYLSIKAIFTKTKREDVYLSCYFIYLITSSFTTTEIYRAGIFGVISLALYLIDTSAMNLKLIPQKKKIPM